jgi:hypothetical protein
MMKSLHKNFHNYSHLQKNKSITLKATIDQTPTHGLFHLPLSQQAHSQMILLQQMFVNTNTNTKPNKWSYIWQSAKFSVHIAYRQLKGHQTVHPAFKWL